MPKFFPPINEGQPVPEKKAPKNIKVLNRNIESVRKETNNIKTVFMHIKDTNIKLHLNAPVVRGEILSACNLLNPYKTEMRCLNRFRNAIP